MIYGYIRVSTDKQTVENQRFEIKKYARREKLIIDEWIEETISGTVSFKKRNLGRLIERTHSGDIIICSELSRLGRSMFMIMSILNTLMENGVLVYTIKENYRLGDDLPSKVLAFAFGISAEIERSLISQRTTEALRRRKAEGKKLGRPLGRHPDSYKLSLYRDVIEEMLIMGIPKSTICTKLHIANGTLYSFLRRENLM